MRFWRKIVNIVLIVGMISISSKIKGVTLPTIPNDTFNVTSYGALGNDTFVNTSAIQATINACYTAGGGVVVIPSGKYLCGPLTLRNKINLYISSGATIKLLPYGSYPNSGTTDKNLMKGFIGNSGLSNIRISGSGTIDGQGKGWWDAYNANEAIARPGIIRFDNSNYIEISGITIINAPNVNITVGKTVTNTTIKGITLIAPSDAPNTDGIDTWSGTIDILNCNISVGDDNIAMDSNSTNILIKGCHFGIGHGCSIGSYAGNVQNITVDSCTFNGTDTGIRMKSSRDRGGVEQNLTYSNLTMVNVITPISILSYYPKTPTTPIDTLKVITTSTPSWSNITLKNIIATGATYAGNNWGLPEIPVTNIVFDSVRITAAYGMNMYNVKDAIFRNGSSINVTYGNAIKANTFTIVDKTSGTAINTIYQSTISGIKLTTGKLIDTTTAIFAIKANVTPNSSGTVTGTGSYLYGNAVTLTAKPNLGYIFDKWTEVSPNNTISNTNEISFASKYDRTLVANFKLDNSSSIDGLSTQKLLLIVSPNPCKDNLIIKVNNKYIGNLPVSIYNELGLIITNFQSNKTEQEFEKNINVRNFTPGVYFIRLNLGNDVITKKFIIQN